MYRGTSFSGYFLLAFAAVLVAGLILYAVLVAAALMLGAAFVWTVGRLGRTPAP